jgi:hypothetical protein
LRNMGSPCFSYRRRLPRRALHPLRKRKLIQTPSTRKPCRCVSWADYLPKSAVVPGFYVRDGNA